MKLLLATNNLGKVREFEALFMGASYEIRTPRQDGLEVVVEESGATLEENAARKALAFRAASGLLTLADDSGLFVDALGGEPGVRSARYAGPGATDEERVRYLLQRLEGVPLSQRTATFRCAIAIAVSSDVVRYAQGACRGIISLRPSGEKGFGYDPVFLVPEIGKTLAELDMETKNAVSHRGQAARAALTILGELQDTEGQEPGAAHASKRM